MKNVRIFGAFRGRKLAVLPGQVGVPSGEPPPCNHNSTRSLNAWVSFGDGTVSDLAQFPIKGTEWDDRLFAKWVAGVKQALADE